MNAIGACYRMSREKTNTLERNGFFGQFRHFHWLLYHRNECATYELRASYPLICSPSLQYSVPLEPFYFICENFLYRSIKHCFLLQLICVSFVLICEFPFFSHTLVLNDDLSNAYFSRSNSKSTNALLLV